VPDASAVGSPARRPVFVCTLLQSLLCTDAAPITCVDVHPGKRLMALTTGKVAYLLDLDTQAVKFRLGRLEGGAEGAGSAADAKGPGAGSSNPLLHCCFDPGATRLATCGNGKSITLWDVSKGSVLRVLEGHLGTVYETRFSPSGPTLYSCSDDGRVGVRPALLA
jgi:WD40 repeat protein